MAGGGEPKTTEARTWRVRAVIYAPGLVAGSPEGGLPEKLEFSSRLPPQAREYHGIPVAIHELPKALSDLETDLPPGVVPIGILLDLEAPDTNQAVEQAAPMLETIIDLISFDIGAALRLGQVEVLDITPPKQVGDKREIGIFGGLPFSLNSRSVDMQAIQGQMQGRLPDSLEIESSRLAAALRWFVKALSTDLLHDQFIFLWIALEILSDDSEAKKVLAPYKGPCGHVIASCPECNRATETVVRGPTLRSFLETFGVDAEKARDLWGMRQLMHGAISFDSKKLESLAEQVQLLRAVVAAALKERLGKSPTDPPFIAPSGLSIHPAVGVGGVGSITEEEMQPLIPDLSS